MGTDLGAKSDPCHPRIPVGRDLRPERPGEAGRRPSLPAASASPARRGGDHRGVTRARRRRTAPPPRLPGQRGRTQRAPHPSRGPSERPAAPSSSGSHPLQAGGRGERGDRAGRPGKPARELRLAGLQERGPPGASAHRTAGTPRFTWCAGGAGGSPGRAGSVSALPHLGGSERPRVAAPHLAGPPLAPTLSARGGAPGWRGGGGGNPGLWEAGSKEGGRFPWLFLCR